MTTSILFTIPNFITAGSGRAMLNIIESLDRDKYSPAVCVSKKGGKLDQEVEKLNIPFIESPFTVSAKPYISLAARVYKESKVFKKYSFDIWHSFHYLDDYTEPMIAKMAGAKAWVYTKKNMNWYRRSWYARSLLADRIAAQNTDMVQDFFSSFLFKSKTHLIPRGVCTKKFIPIPQLNPELKQQLKIEKDEILLGCVAHLVPVKGHPTLIEAMKQVPKAHLVIAGKPLDQDYTKSLHDLIHQLNLQDRIHFLGPVEDVQNLLGKLDLFIFPTWKKWRMEGCPVALLEAMACGKPCIATNIPGSRDIIENYRNGLLVEPEDPNMMAQAIKELCQDSQKRKQLGDAARKRIMEYFTLDKEVKLHEAIYEELSQ